MQYMYLIKSFFGAAKHNTLNTPKKIQKQMKMKHFITQIILELFAGG